MQGEIAHGSTYYRCSARTLTPGSALAGHPAIVNFREDALVRAINGWIGQLFDPAHRDETVAKLLG